MIKTVKVKCILSQADGSKAINTQIEFRLPLREIDNGVVLPQVIKAQADENGEVTVPLWPNEVGVQSSYYDVTIFTNSKIVHDCIVVPNEDCYFHDILQRRPFPSIDAAQQAVIEAQKSATEAKKYAEQASSGSGSSGSYTLPIASIETLGGIKVGENLTITQDGTLNAVVLQGKEGDKGLPGIDGKAGLDGKDGINGLSAYEIAVNNGFKGVESEWLKSLHGKDNTNDHENNDEQLFRINLIDQIVYFELDWLSPKTDTNEEIRISRDEIINKLEDGVYTAGFFYRKTNSNIDSIKLIQSCMEIKRHQINGKKFTLASDDFILFDEKGEEITFTTLKSVSGEDNYCFAPRNNYQFVSSNMFIFDDLQTNDEFNGITFRLQEKEAEIVHSEDGTSEIIEEAVNFNLQIKQRAKFIGINLQKVILDKIKIDVTKIIGGK